MSRVDTVNLINSIINASARRYNSLKSETPIAKTYAKLNNSAQGLSFSTPGLKTEELEKKYLNLDKKFIAAEQEYKDLEALGLLEHAEEFIKKNTTTLQIKQPEQEGQATFKLSRGGVRDGAGRKKKEGREVRKVSLSLPPEWWQEIDSIKKHSKLSQTDILNNLLVPILAICSSTHNMDYIKSEANVMKAIEKYFGK
jgi:hypothetical protein